MIFKIVCKATYLRIVNFRGRTPPPLIGEMVPVLVEGRLIYTREEYFFNNFPDFSCITLLDYGFVIFVTWILIVSTKIGMN
jgi:hypothetical protein